MPFLNTSKRQECILDTIDAISILQSVIDDHPNHHFIIGGDFNTELCDVSPFDHHWRDLQAKHDLQLCDNLVSGHLDYTYSHDTLNQRKWNDHFLVSKGLIASTSNHQILEVGSNHTRASTIRLFVISDISNENIFHLILTF